MRYGKTYCPTNRPIQLFSDIGEGGQCCLQIYSTRFTVSRDETLEMKHILFLQNSSKSHLQQCRISEHLGNDPWPSALKGNGDVKKRRVGRGEGGTDKAR